MKVTIHKLFDYLLETTAHDPPECFIGFSLARSPRLKDFLPDLDPELSLDWNGKSFLGLPSLRQRVLEQASLTLDPDSVLITAGAAEANYLLFRQLVQAGDEIVTEAPGWPCAAGRGGAGRGAGLVARPRSGGPRDHAPDADDLFDQSEQPDGAAYPGGRPADACRSGGTTWHLAGGGRGLRGP